MEEEKEFPIRDEIFSKVLRAGRRTYFFDVRETRAGDYYMTITESKKFNNDDGSSFYKKHKIYLYKEDFNEFRDCFKEISTFITDKKGSEVISEKHQSDFKKDEYKSSYHESEPSNKEEGGAFSDVKFEDI